ncbi:MAG: hypothetical protein KIS94_08905 [Chitinophagales bacterium]|nr:hypothetical protein [Chitinophagales bacterium]
MPTTFLKLAVVYLMSYIVGHVLVNIFNVSSANSAKSVFLKLFVGLFAQVILFSLFIAKGITINSGIVILSVFILLRLNRPISFNQTIFRLRKEEFKWIAWGGAVLLFFFALRCFMLSNKYGDFPAVINMDSLKHVIRAAFLVSTGIESVNVNYLVLPTGVDPYHYFEAWTIGYFGTFLQMNYWLTEQLIVFPLVCTVVIIGFWALLSQWSNVWHHYAVACLIVFFTGFCLNEVKFLKNSGGFQINAFDEWKGFAVAFTYLVVILFFNLLFSRQHIVFSLLVLLFLPLISITLAPPILTVVFVLVFLLTVAGNKIGVNVKYYDLLFPLLVAAYIFCFYQLFEPSESYIVKPKVAKPLELLSSVSILYSRAIIVAEKFIQAVIIYSPFGAFALFGVFRNQTWRSIFSFQSKWVLYLLFLSVLLPIAVFFWQVFYGSFGASQFLFYTSLPFVNVSLLLATIVAAAKLRHKVANLMYAVLAVCMTVFFLHRSYTINETGKQNLFYKYSPEYIAEVRNEISKLSNRYGLKIENPASFVKFNDSHHLVGNFLPGYFNDTYMFSYTLAEMYFKDIFPSKQAAMLLPKAPLVTYCKRLSDQSKFVSLNETVTDMVSDGKISYVFTSSNMNLLPELKKFVAKEIVDGKSKERFYLLATD